MIAALAQLVFWVLLTAAVSYTTAKITTRERGSRKYPAPVCGCGHHLSFHGEGDDKGRRCNYDGPSYRQCGCQRYYGPEPIAQVYLP